MYVRTGEKIPDTGLKYCITGLELMAVNQAIVLCYAYSPAELIFEPVLEVLLHREMLEEDPFPILRLSLVEPVLEVLLHRET